MSQQYKNEKFDIFPLVFPVGENVEFTIKALAKIKAFKGEYVVRILRLDAGSPREEFYKDNCIEIKCKTDESGALRFNFTAEVECEHYVRIYDGENRLEQLAVYAVEGDLATRYPLRGDFHVHSTGSDGREDPHIVCANYRRKGYDFMCITDHGNYYPSLDAIEFYKDVKLALNIMPGEEVHLPGTTVHIVNVGGLFSVNGLFTMKENYWQTNGELSRRRFDDSITPPDIVDMDEYWAQLDEIVAQLKGGDNPIPDDVDAKSYAACLYAYQKIKEADGLSVFAHPYWLEDVWQISDKFTRYMLENHPFDAFEVLGGENYYAQNGFQTALYYEECMNGRKHPIVGATDSHGSTAENRNWDICSTIVFAKNNERKDIISAVKDRYSVAVDTISKEYRLVGDFRLIKYASFLMERYFPIHDKQAYIDGEMTYQYAIGNATKNEVESVADRAKRLIEKYILLRK